MTRFTCDQCRRLFRGQPSRSLTGRTLCPDCYGTLLAAAAGAAAAGPGADASVLVGHAIATAGWFQRLRAHRRREAERRRAGEGSVGSGTSQPGSLPYGAPTARDPGQ